MFCFENRGEEIGVTLHHPHGQIYAYPFVTPRTERMLGPGRRRTGSGPAATCCADVLAAERRAGTRVVLAGEHWTAYVPAAARWPVEVHLAPHRDVPDLPALDDGERDELAALYLELLRRVDRYYDGVAALPYIAGWHQAPVGEGRDLGRLHLQLFSVLRAPGEAEVPGRVGVRDGRVGERLRARADRRPAARGRLVSAGAGLVPGTGGRQAERPPDLAAARSRPCTGVRPTACGRPRAGST